MGCPKLVRSKTKVRVELQLDTTKSADLELLNVLNEGVSRSQAIRDALIFYKKYHNKLDELSNNETNLDVTFIKDKLNSLAEKFDDIQKNGLVVENKDAKVSVEESSNVVSDNNTNNIEETKSEESIKKVIPNDMTKEDNINKLFNSGLGGMLSASVIENVDSE